MAALTDAQRKEVFEEWMRENKEACSITKADLRAVFNAADDWVNTNAAAYNSALPQPGRGALSAAQKASILTTIAEKRWEVGA